MKTLLGTQFDPCYEGLSARLPGRPRASSHFPAFEANGIGVLSNREVEVLRALAIGLRNREIARSLMVSEKTVERHLENICNKLDITGRVSAAVYAVRNGLVG